MHESFEAIRVTVNNAPQYHVISSESCPDCERGESTYCGSFCEWHLADHCEECEVCAKDFS